MPVFGTPLDDDIVGTAGRLASEEGEEGEGGAVIEALFVVEVPMSLPLDARVPDDRITQAKKRGRAREGGRRGVRGRRGRDGDGARAIGRPGDRVRGQAARGGGDRARRRGAEPHPRRHAAGRPAEHARDKALGEMTRYVLEKAPCRVILTAPPSGEDTTRDAVAPE